MSEPAVLFADDRLLIVNKPAGLPAHPARAGGPSVEDFFAPWRRGRTGPWLAHRLDRDTAGCLAVARKKAALLACQAAFAEGRAAKTYWAAVQGVPAEAEGVITIPLQKITRGRQWTMQAGGDAPAITRWRVMGQDQNVAWLELKPATGRTHQLRAHCAILGHPILGDPVYGSATGPLMLLARALVLPLDPPAAATAPVPQHMRSVLQACGHAE